MSMLDRMKELGNKATVRAFKLGEEADTLSRKAGKLDRKPNKTREEEEEARELRKEAVRMREQQEQARQITQGMGLGEKILRCYFAYKMASLLCSTLVGLTGNYYDRDRAIGHAVASGIDRAADKLADNIVEQTQGEGQDINEERAKLIEQTIDSFEKMSQQAQEQGLTKEGEPLLSDNDKERLRELANISRDTQNEQQAEQYAAKCQELGLDYNDALVAFKEDRTIDLDKLQKDNEQERENEMEYTI